jgi:hypothetical protein
MWYNGDTMDTEMWKAIPEFPGYEVSNRGLVRSYWQRGNFADKWKIGNEPNRILKTVPAGSKKEYRAVVLCRDGHKFLRRIAPLVALVFLGPRPDGLEVCHNDGDPTNDRLDNLRYDTHKSNMEDASRQTQWPSGEAHAQSQHTNEFARQLRKQFGAGISTPHLAQEYNVLTQTVSNIVYGHIYKDAGGPIAESPLLSDDDVKQIRCKRADGASLQELSKEYNLSESGISRIVLGQRRSRAGGPIQLVPWQRPT